MSFAHVRSHLFLILFQGVSSGIFVSKTPATDWANIIERLSVAGENWCVLERDLRIQL